MAANVSVLPWLTVSWLELPYRLLSTQPNVNSRQIDTHTHTYDDNDEDTTPLFGQINGIGN